MGSKPSKVSEPLEGRDFPGRRGIPQTAKQWLRLKQKNDQKKYSFDSNLWCIHNKLYDLNSFMDFHPGGRHWLELTKGIECTAAFETHHLNMEKVKNMLEKYYVRDVVVKNKEENENENENENKNKNILKNDQEILKLEGEFNWNDDNSDQNFFFSLRKQIYDYFQTQYPNGEWRYPRISMHILSALALILWSGSFGLLITRPNIYTSTLAGICLHPFLGIGHNFFHQADFKTRFNKKKSWFWSKISETWWRYLFDFSGFSWREWRISHVLSHHVYINLNSDYEVSALEPAVHFMTNQKTNNILIYIYWHIFHYSLSLIDMFRRSVGLLIGKEKFTWSNLFPLLQIIMFRMAQRKTGLSWWALLAYWYHMHGVANYLLILVSTPIHRSDYCWTEGDSNATKDFGLHTILTTRDYWVNSNLAVSLFFFEMFNDHALHHMFPTLDMSRIREIRPIYEKHLQKFGLQDKAKSYNWFTLFLGLFRHLYRVRTSKLST